LDYVEFELKTLPELLVKNHAFVYDLPSAELQARGVQNIRVQNLAITIDKVMHLLNVMNTQEPPIYPLNGREVYERLWSSEKSLKSQLAFIVDCLRRERIDQSQAPLVAEIQKLISQPITLPGADPATEAQFKEVNDKVRERLLTLSDCFWKLRCESVAAQQLSDILFLYGQTHTFFTQNCQYQKVTGTEVQVRVCDVTSEKRLQAELTAADQASIFYRGVKEYDGSFIWGQLAGWFKQTVDKPNASLSAERRGTLSYPDLDSFITSKSFSAVKKTCGHGCKRPCCEEDEEPEVSGHKKRGKKPGLYPFGVLPLD
jgi:hypothetical protein